MVIDGEYSSVESYFIVNASLIQMFLQCIRRVNMGVTRYAARFMNKKPQLELRVDCISFAQRTAELQSARVRDNILLGIALPSKTYI